MNDKELRRMAREVNVMIPHIEPMTTAQRVWAMNNCFPNEICLCKGEAWCTACSNIFPLSKQEVEGGEYICPHCGRKLKVRSTTRSKIDEWTFMSVIQVFRGYQVLRHYKVYKYASRVRTSLRYRFDEVAQNWIDSCGELVTARKAWCTGGCRSYGFLYDSKLLVRPEDYKYGSWKIQGLEIYAYHIYPKIEVLPILRRNGFRSSFHNISPCDVFRELLRSNNSEMLWKTKQYGILAYKIKKGWRSDTQYPEAVRIAIRNKYYVSVKDVELWYDYLDMLHFFRKDLHNAHYVCPKNIKKDHDKLHEKYVREVDRRRKERQQYEIQKWESFYKENFSRFFALVFSDGEVKVKVIQSVADVYAEGKAMHHCVYDNGYYQHKENLLLSATVNNERKETVEVNLQSFKVVQSRGVCNSTTPYHDRIVELVEANMPKIQAACC